jgi:hypothetical protein
MSPISSFTSLQTHQTGREREQGGHSRGLLVAETFQNQLAEPCGLAAALRLRDSRDSAT